jgi:hypothetical protein
MKMLSLLAWGNIHEEVEEIFQGTEWAFFQTP